jgi:hypothetical protein
MLDRRGFVMRAMAGLGGALLLPRSGPAAAWLPASYQRKAMRWHGNRLVDSADEAVGTFVVFAPMRAGTITGALDLFEVTASAPGDARSAVLTPLGRVADLATARATILTAVHARAAAARVGA